jgi:hypothetical protein
VRTDLVDLRIPFVCFQYVDNGPPFLDMAVAANTLPAPTPPSRVEELDYQRLTRKDQIIAEES